MPRSLISRIVGIPAAGVIGCVRIYQTLISPMIPATCRFQPTCSAYAIEAIGRYGLLRGGGKAVWRIMRCHPWCEGGEDPP